MNVDPSGHVVWWITAAAIGIAWNVFWWAVDRFYEYKYHHVRWNWRRDGASLAYAVVTGAVSGILAELVGPSRAAKIGYGIYTDIKWYILSWALHGPPRNKWQAVRDIAKTIAQSIISGLH